VKNERAIISLDKIYHLPLLPPQHLPRPLPSRGTFPKPLPMPQPKPLPPLLIPRPEAKDICP